MQRVWNFPMGTKQGCPQDRESSGHVGIHVKKNAHILLCVQTDTSAWGCVCTYAYLHQQILILLCITGFGGVGGLEKLEERKLLPPLWWYVHSPCFSHQHWPKPIVDSAATCDDGEGRNGNCKNACPVLPFVKFLGQQKCFNGPNPLHLPKASALANPEIFPAA